MQLTPADIYQWRGPSANITDDSRRIPSEQKWYALTACSGGCVSRRSLLVMGADADHRPGKIVVEVPANPFWCPIRKAVCAWTNAKFPFRTNEQWGFYLLRRPVVTVIGKAFYDIDHSGKNPQRNRRNYDSSLAVWEIHPFMKLVQNGP